MSAEYTYIIAGAGTAGVAAVEGVREKDRKGSILLIGNDRYPPYDRPPLSKQLWWGLMKTEEIFVHDDAFFKHNGVDLLLGRTIVSIDTSRRTVVDDQGKRYHYEKLLLATGGAPRRLPIPGGDSEGIRYYRCLDDYYAVRTQLKPGTTVTAVGGGFIGAELSASLTMNDAKVTTIFPENSLCARVLPAYLGASLQESFVRHGVTVVHNDKPVAFEKRDGKFVTRTEKGRTIESDIVIAGIGILPETKLAEMAGLATDRGIVVNEYQQTSDPAVFAAGDNAVFPYLALGKSMRVEHWDHAVHHGRNAGRNMAGARTAYDYLPNFFSDMFEFTYQAVGEISAELQSIPDWQAENEKGTIYFLRNGRLNGIIFCNVSGDIEEARRLVRKGEVPERLLALAESR